MKVVKYLGSKQGGMPVTFPIGAKSRGAVTHFKTANPYLELTDDEAETLLAADMARVAKSGEYKKDVIDRRGHVVRVDTVTDAPDAKPNFELADEDEYKEWKKSGGDLPKPKKRSLSNGEETEVKLPKSSSPAEEKPAETETPAKPKRSSAKKPKSE